MYSPSALLTYISYCLFLGFALTFQYGCSAPTTLEPDPPARGLIYDRNHNLLVANKQTFTLEITPEHVSCTKNNNRSACLRQLLKHLHRFIPITENDLAYFWKTLRHKKNRNIAVNKFAFFREKFRPVKSQYITSIPIRSNLTNTERAIIKSKLNHLPGIHMTRRSRRQYIYSNSLTHIIGYVSQNAIFKNMWTHEERENYEGTTHVGSKGIEKQYEKILHGTVGQIQIEHDTHGSRIKETVLRPAIPGKNIYLTIDIRLQNLAEDLLGDKTGAVVAIDPNNGEILALVSKPGYDPNEFIDGISQEKYNKLRSNPKKPLNPRALVGTYPPGSTIKPFFGLAGLYYNAMDPDQRIDCNGKFYLPEVKRPWHDWKKEGHGKVDLQTSIMRSCDVYYYKLATKLGIDKITNFLQLFGIGAKTGIDMPYEKPGVLPSRRWKYTRFKHLSKKHPSITKWFRGDTVSVGIGQGYITVTPMQLALATATIATKGRMMQPHLLYAKETPGSNKLLYTQPKIKRVLTQIKQKDWQRITDDMVTVVHKKWAGTAWRTAEFTQGKYLVAGKTGTAQVVKQSMENVTKKTAELPENERDHTLFIAFAPARKPKIAVVVVAEHSGPGSSAATPIAARLIQAYMNLNSTQSDKVRNLQLEQTIIDKKTISNDRISKPVY